MSELTSQSASRDDARPAAGRAPTVLKFGGTSVADAAACARVAAIVRAHGGPRPVVVVSALAGVTDALLASVALAPQPSRAVARRTLAEQLDRHEAVAERLLTPARAASFANELERAKREIAALLSGLDGRREEQARLEDEIASYGERLSAPLLAAVLAVGGLPAHHVDARRCVITDETHGRASPLPDTAHRIRAELVPLLADGLLPVLGGYIAATPDGATTTLGRGGSDYTAALLGAALEAREIQIWTDVSGVLTADPRVVPSARTIPSLSYAEAAELAYFGAKVLHPKTIQPAMDCGIPVRICNSQAPDEPGTLVTAHASEGPGTAKAIAHKTGITVLQITSTGMLGAYGFLRALFEVFERHRTVVDVVTTSEVSVSLSVEDPSALSAIVAELRRLGTVSVEPDRAIICVVGEGLRTTPGIAARVFATVSDINISLISQGASRVNLTFVVDQGRVREAVRRLHAAFFEREPADRGAAAAAGEGVP